MMPPSFPCLCPWYRLHCPEEGVTICYPPPRETPVWVCPPGAHPTCNFTEDSHVLATAPTELLWLTCPQIFKGLLWWVRTMICGVPRTRTRIHGGDGGEAKFSSVRAARNRSYQEWAVGGWHWKRVDSLTLQMIQKSLEAHQAQLLERPNILDNRQLVPGSSVHPGFQLCLMWACPVY